jgi:hypothetical protein
MLRHPPESQRRPRPILRIVERGGVEAGLVGLGVCGIRIVSER